MKRVWEKYIISEFFKVKLQENDYVKSLVLAEENTALMVSEVARGMKELTFFGKT